MDQDIIEEYHRMKVNDNDDPDLILEDEELEDCLFEIDDDNQSDIQDMDETFYGRDDTEWSSIPTVPHPKLFCNEKSEPTPIAANAKTPIECWELFVPFLDEIVECTNIFINSIKYKYSREDDCKEVNAIELKAVFGLLYLAAGLKLNYTNVKDIWDKDYGVEIFWLTMPYKRFLFILNALRFDDITTREDRVKNDKLAPIRSIYEQLNQKFQSNFNCGQSVCIDEMLVKFFGKCRFRVYIPSKPGKYGIKIFSVVDYDSSYTSKIEIYCGIQEEGPYQMPKEHNTGFEVIKRLTEHLIGCNRTVTADNWFSSKKIVDYLYDNNTTYVGTLRSNRREVPKPMVCPQGRDNNSCLFLFSNNCSLVSKKVNNKKCVLIISSLHQNADMIRPGQSKSNEYYNKTKGGVDTVDKINSGRDVSRSCRRWPLKIFYNFLNLISINSYAIYKANNQQPKDIKLFVQILGRSLIKEKMESRLMQPNVPKKIKIGIRKFLYKDDPIKRVKRIKLDKKEKKQNCELCDWHSRLKVQTQCDYCNALICHEHSTILCKNCEN